jgi:hypothetical protein
VLQGAGGEELVQLLELHLARRSPAQQRRHHHQVIGAGLVSSPVGGQGRSWDAEALGQALRGLGRHR